jgi:hypothetical protein
VNHNARRNASAASAVLKKTLVLKISDWPGAQPGLFDLDLYLLFRAQYNELTKLLRRLEEPASSSALRLLISNQEA